MYAEKEGSCFIMAKTKRQKQTASNVQRRAQVSQHTPEVRRNASSTSVQPRGGKVRRRATANRSPWLFIGSIIVVLAVVVGIFVFISNQASSNSNGQVNTPVDATTFKQVTQVDPSLLSQTGTGGVANPFQVPKTSQPSLLGPTGKPEMFYYGAEFCPNCAAERWSMVVALSRFGTFSKLIATTSSSTDSDPDTSTFTFAQSNYSSSYVDFVPLENTDRQKNIIQTPTADQQQLLTQYNVTGYPFIDIGNRYLITVASYDPALLRSNPKDSSSQPLSQQDIASQLATGNTLSKNILGVANYLTAAICTSTNNQPSTVCSDASIQQIESSLAKLSVTSGGAGHSADVGPLDMVRRQENNVFMQ